MNEEGAPRAKAGTLARVLDWFEARVNVAEAFSFLTSFGLFTSEIDTRKPIREAIGEAFEKPIPSYARWPRVLGIITMLLFLLQCLTGTLLALYYRPTTASAYGSVQMILSEVSLGWFVQQVHFWGSRLLVFILLLRLLRLLYDGLYRSPRELLWVVGILLFISTTHADFTGRLLTMESDNFWAAVRAIDLFGTVPLLGDFFLFTVGGAGLDDITLIRFYLAHIFVLPLFLFMLFYLQFQGVRRVGLSQAADETPESGRAAYKRYILNLMILLALLFALLVTVAVLLPRPFSARPDLLSTPAGVQLPWYLLPIYGFYELVPGWVPVSIKGAVMALTTFVVMLLPFLDRGPAVRLRERKLAGALAAGFILLLVLLALYGYRHA